MSTMKCKLDMILVGEGEGKAMDFRGNVRAREEGQESRKRLINSQIQKRWRTLEEQQASSKKACFSKGSQRRRKEE